MDRVRELVAPLVADADLDLYDLDLAGGVLPVLVDAPGGADIDAISRLARTISRALDEHDPIDGKYALEVGSPGLERPLRTPAHFAGAVGTTVKVKTQPGVEGDRRVEGTITAADDDGGHRPHRRRRRPHPRATTTSSERAPPSSGAAPPSRTGRRHKA